MHPNWEYMGQPRGDIVFFGSLLALFLLGLFAGYLLSLKHVRRNAQGKFVRKDGTFQPRHVKTKTEGK